MEVERGGRARGGPARGAHGQGILEALHPVITVVVRAHYAIACVRCIATAEVCARRAAGLDGAPLAKERFERAGWVHDPHVTRRDLAGKTPEWVARVGAGNWYCRACARKAKIGR